MRCIQTSIGRFHHFHLARQLNRRGLLDKIYTGYPRFKLRDETGIVSEKIITFPWIHAPYLALNRLGLDQYYSLSKFLANASHNALDHFVANQIKVPSILIAMAGTGLYSGKKNKRLDGIYICDSGSSNISYLSEILHDEYERWGMKWREYDAKNILKTQEEYEQADYISVPSQFCVDSFLGRGFAPGKILKIPYGARTDRFFPSLNFQKHLTQSNKYRILFVGQASIRKGIADLLTAFKSFSHPKKELRIVGTVTSEAKELINKINCKNIELTGHIPNHQLRTEYTMADVFVLPSIEDGFGMVIGEAMACGCPVIASTNTGASELITDGVEGFIVPIRSPETIADRLQQLADDPDLRARMGQAALARVKQIGGWDDYGEQWAQAIKKIQTEHNHL